MLSVGKAEIVRQLQSQIDRLEGHKPIGSMYLRKVLNPIAKVLPNHTLDHGIHEFISGGDQSIAITSGFVAGLINSFMQSSGALVWIGSSQNVFPPALKCFGISPERCLFITLPKNKDALWAMDEALKCSALAAVVCELKHTDLTISRRLQLAAEKNCVTGFILLQTKHIQPTACISRWRISALPSDAIVGDLPGIGFPKWKVELLKIRSGKPGVLNIQWINNKFINEEESTGTTLHQNSRMVG